MLLVHKQKERYAQAFFLGLLVSGLFLGFYIVQNNGYFLYYGDFNVQQIPFYRLAHDAVRSGNWFWNWNTDLGVNFVGSYSFYMLGSPFFWLTLAFPSAAVPYLMGPLLMLKFACASLTAYAYLRRFTRFTHNALIGALLYAFSGFSVYNVFFNHFHEAIVLFPLLLMALEQLVTENRRGVFGVMVFFTAFSNYFFFVGMVVFVLLYFGIKTFSRSWHMTWSRFGVIALEAVLGVAMAAGLLLPTYLAICDMNRVNGYLVGWNAVIYSQPQVFYNILQSFFFPPDNPARLVFFPDNSYQWSSMSGWLPLVSMTGVIAWLQTKKGTWQKRLMTTCLIMALVPFLNSAFYAFNYSYYARWYYMLLLILCLVTVQALEDPEINWASAFRWSIGITLAITLVVGLMPSLHTNEDGFSRFGLYKDANAEGGTFYTARFWIECAIALGCLLLFLFLMLYRTGFGKKKEGQTLGARIRGIRKQEPFFWRAMVCCVCVVSVLYSAVHIGWGKTHSDSKDFLINNMLQGSIDLDIEDGERIDVLDGMDNTAMYLGYPSIQAFHSIVPLSTFDFYRFAGVERGVASRPEPENYAIRGLLGVRYLVDYRKSGDTFTAGDGDDATIPGFRYVKTENGFDVFENAYYIPYGFTYDTCLTQDTVTQYYDSYHANILLKAMVLSDEDVARYGHLFRVIDGSSLYETEDFGKAGYLADCKELRATSEGNTIDIDNRGFTAEVTLDKENLVFYSVPYDAGWSVTVDGEKADVIRANVGFMAVDVPAGTHTIRFEYHTPGLVAGITVAIVAWLAMSAYLLLMARYRRRHPDAVVITDTEREALEAEWAKQDAAEIAVYGSCLSPVNESKGDKKP